MNSQEQNQNPTPHDTSFGATIGIIVIVIAVVLGALYVWGGQISNQRGTTQTTNITATSTATTTTAVAQ
jgi:uncharacterized membrane protein (DUF485 family)